ncbi:hypothetical protein ACJMK2_017025 [Sinanodonta woodiana]|uniref:EF-hand domain-containing protein n=1 Tax=Sinanodonta woodiana TaxID=1069815 RepID=A0ABD3UVK7_SINWO
MSKFKACLILLVLLLNDFEAFGNAIPIMKAITTDCGFICRKLCPIIDPNKKVSPDVGCHVKCSDPCKRGIPDVPSRFQTFSQDFNHYDVNGDTLISPKEFSTAENVPLVEVNDMFQFADKNDDHMLDSNEFEMAPFNFTSKQSDLILRFLSQATVTQDLVSGTKSPVDRMFSNSTFDTASGYAGHHNERDTFAKTCSIPFHNRGF